MKGLARFLLLLLLVLPAMQARAHQAETPPVMAMHDLASHDMMAMHHARHGAPGEAPSPAHASYHDCIGCIAPIDISLYRPASAPDLVAARRKAPASAAYLLARASAPEPPPPRASV